MEKHYMFAYGANTNKESMSERCPGAVCIGPAWVNGYSFRWRQHADIELADDDDYALGLLWELNNEHLENLDHFEGYPHYYFRQRVIIKTSSKDYVGWAYMMTEQNHESLPSNGYKKTVFEGYESHGISDEQLIRGLTRLNG